MQGRTVQLYLIVFSLATILAGCGASQVFTRRAVDYNKAIEAVQNKGLLLNIVRASKRQPLHLTTFSIVRGSSSSSVTFGFEIPFGSDADDAFTVRPSGTLGQGPSFDLVPLDTQEFWRGFLNPIGITTADYYLNQQWPKELIYYLLVEKIEVVKDDNIIDEADNYPQRTDQFMEFKTMLENLIDAGLRTKQTIAKKAIGPPLSVEQAANLEHLVEAAKAGLSVEKVEGGFQLVQRKPDISFCTETSVVTGIGVRLPTCAQASAIEAAEPPQTNLKYQSLPAPAPDEAHSGRKTGQEDAEKETGLRIYFRSAEGVLYYLGELARTQLEGNSGGVQIRPGGERNNLFVVRRGGVGQNALVEITHEGTRYFISREGAGRSAQALSLLLQLLALNKSFKDLPVTGVVTVVGG